MKKILLILLLISPLVAPTASAQYTLIKGDNVLEVSGMFSAYANYRFYPAGSTNYKKNSMTLDYAIVKFEGTKNRKLHYCFQFNLARLTMAAGGTTEDPGAVMDVFAEYTGFKYFDVKFGFFKIPFGFYSLLPVSESMFLQRPEMARGDVFSRRDMGVTLTRSFYNDRLMFVGGVFTGVGESILNGGDNDASGKLEYVGRVEAGYPIKSKYREVDIVGSPTPVFTVGAGMRYAEKATDTGTEYNINTINGKKTSYSADIRMRFRHLMIMAEIMQFHMVPADSARLLGLPTDYFNAGGFITGLSYYFKPVKTALGVRYDELNPNDLVKGDTRRTLSASLNYFFNEQNSAIKIHYFYRYKLQGTSTKWSPDQLRIAYQLMF